MIRRWRKCRKWGSFFGGPRGAEGGGSGAGTCEESEGDEGGEVGKHVEELMGDDFGGAGECGEIGLKAVEGAEEKCAENEAFEFPASEDDEGEYEEALSGGHVHLEGVAAQGGEVSAGEAGTGSGEEDGGDAPGADFDAHGVAGVGCVTEGADDEAVAGAGHEEAESEGEEEDEIEEGVLVEEDWAKEGDMGEEGEGEGIEEFFGGGVIVGHVVLEDAPGGGGSAESEDVEGRAGDDLIGRGRGW